MALSFISKKDALFVLINFLFAFNNGSGFNFNVNMKIVLKSPSSPENTLNSTFFGYDINYSDNQQFR